MNTRAPRFSFHHAAVMSSGKTVAQIAHAAEGLQLLECNPVLIHRDGAVVVDATAKEVAT